MDSHAIKVPVITSVSVDCIFWQEAGGWTGACGELSLAVHGTDFEQAKKNMKAALQCYVSELIHERKMAA